MSPTEKWAVHISQQALSGLSQAAYCRRHDLHPTSFSQWKRRLREDDRGTGFIALPLPASPCQEAKSAMFQVRLNNGLKVVLPLNISPDQLATIVAVLKGL
jgi:transposase-like protein